MNIIRAKMEQVDVASEWMECFHRQTADVIGEPFLCCLSEAIAAVESGRGRWAIRGEDGLNEIGYKALAGHPRTRVNTRESIDGELCSVVADFRLFADRNQQARALLYLMRSSRFFEAARFLYRLTLCSAYAPGREAGAKAVVLAFNERARSGAHEGIHPILMIEGETMDPGERTLNHEAARMAVGLFADMTQPGDVPRGGCHG